MPQDKPVTDPTVNPQAGQPGQVEPQRTPGSAPSVTRLPAGAAPNVEARHPLPEEAIDGYPSTDALYAEDDVDREPQEPGTEAAADTSSASSSGPAKKATSGTSSAGSTGK
jgi:hypothetical protein